MSNEIIAGVITESTAHVARQLIDDAGEERSTWYDYRWQQLGVLLQMSGHVLPVVPGLCLQHLLSTHRALLTAVAGQVHSRYVGLQLHQATTQL